MRGHPLRRRTLFSSRVFNIFHIATIVVVVARALLTVDADEQGNPEVEKDPRQRPDWNDPRETFVPLNEDARRETTARDGDRPWIEHVSWEPRVYVYHNFLSEKEAIHLRERYHSRQLAAAKSKKSDEEEENNTSVSFARSKDEIVNEIEQRLSAFTMIPESHGEDMFVTKTAKGYAQRFETLDEEKEAVKLANGGQRFATTALFLNTLTDGKGGELVFPMGTKRLFGGSSEGGSDNHGSNAKDSATGSTLSECARKHKVVVSPRAGDAVLWFSTHHNGFGDTKSASLRCNVTANGEEMFTAYKHWRVGRYNHGNFLRNDDAMKPTTYASSSEF